MILDEWDWLCHSQGSALCNLQEKGCGHRKQKIYQIPILTKYSYFILNFEYFWRVFWPFFNYPNIKTLFNSWPVKLRFDSFYVRIKFQSAVERVFDKWWPVPGYSAPSSVGISERMVQWWWSSDRNLKYCSEDETKHSQPISSRWNIGQFRPRIH